MRTEKEKQEKSDQAVKREEGVRDRKSTSRG